MKNKQILNLINRINSKYNKVLPIFAYDDESSLFDVYLNTVLNINFMSMNNYLMPGIPTNGLVTNKPVHYAQQNSRYQQYLLCPKYIFYHENAPVNMKKEDKKIIANNLRNAKNVSFIENNNWINENMVHMRYGLPGDLIQQYHNTDKDKKIAVLNFNNNEPSNIILQQLQNSNIEADSLSDPNLDLKDYISIISSYKIIIDVYSSFNRLLALACGCIVISGNNYLEPDMIMSCDSIIEIVQKTQEALTKNNFSIDTKYLLSKYNESQFIKNMYELLL
jgi:hypothetical protein